jgi:hypothetical protein
MYLKFSFHFILVNIRITQHDLPIKQAKVTLLGKMAGG